MASYTTNPTISSSRPPQASEKVAAASGISGLTVKDYANAGRQTRVSLSNVTITTTYTSSSNSSGSVKIATLPLGGIFLKGGSARVTYTTSGTPTPGGTTVFAVGTAAAAADATLTSTEANVVASTGSTMTAGAGTLSGVTATSVVGVNGQSSAVDIYLNFATSGDMGAARTITLNGWVVFNWEHTGDNTIA
jgi:hypothetical protein